MLAALRAGGAGAVGLGGGALAALRGAGAAVLSARPYSSEVIMTAAPRHVWLNRLLLAQREQPRAPLCMRPVCAPHTPAMLPKHSCAAHNGARRGRHEGMQARHGRLEGMQAEPLDVLHASAAKCCTMRGGVTPCFLWLPSAACAMLP